MSRQMEMVNLLIVDDTPAHIKTAGTILKELGYPVRAAANAGAALKLIAKQIPTVLLLDLAMPGMDGFELMQVLKKEPFYDDMAILCVTASNDRESIEKGFSLGARDYVVKPYRACELLARVKTHIQIIRQAKELKHSYEELDQFCLNVSHDLRSPLHTISQLCRLLETSLPNSSPEQISAILKRIQDKSGETARMTERLLDLSKVSQAEYQKIKVDLNRMLPSVFDDLKDLYGRRDIRFHMEQLPDISGDPDLLRILFQNVIGNAVKFTQGRSTAEISVSSGITNEWITVNISDNGAGFCPEQTAKLFQVFERLHTQEEFEGTGVGLTIVKRIMQRHCGKVSITGQAGQGACVTLRFPVT
ncbi:hybrid sensor histidine kinase/response regulator [Anaerostipes sp.]|uniref:hybrid sensor histidine kinase/response regulator n=1 Tax=Anaerostipes sp. TaxID=1872530 RepID=UPI0025C24B8A|nr:hybrid sensor histidine kinase/response regulator [Anaerostipes sp.]MBS7007315.1 hybrid sensor histidine kinase/response regulator [Anaerostipes sp.]